MKRDYDNVPPEAEAMISSLRAFGYDLSKAIADLIDNSISAKAKKITIDYDWNAGNPWVRIVDNGDGMTLRRLKKAMRLGSQSPLIEREEDDLGRFGLGLKTASFSQCKLLTVTTVVSSGRIAIRCWDLDRVIRTNEWQLSHFPPDGAEPLLDTLDLSKSGTIVLWQNLDRLIGDDHADDENSQEIFLERFQKVVQYIEMVFHRFLTGKDRISISVGRHNCKPWDPFLTSNKFTQEFSTEKIDDQRVNVTPFVLPHVSKRSKTETEMGSGLYGWNAHQGFYVYRNKRMIILGGYLDFDFLPEEHFKLCRIRVDLPNNLDHDWSIDVRKASASPPSRARNDLERIAKANRANAVRIYRARSGTARNYSKRKDNQDIWKRKLRGEKIIYEINRENEVIKLILEEINPTKSWVRKLFHLLEKSVPHRVIIMDNADHEDCHVDLPPTFDPPPKELLDLCKKLFLDKIGKNKNPEDVVDFVCSLFDNHVDYRIMLENLIEDIQ